MKRTIPSFSASTKKIRAYFPLQQEIAAAPHESPPANPLTRDQVAAPRLQPLPLPKTEVCFEAKVDSAAKSMDGKETFQTILPTSLLKCFLNPMEVANLVVFLASEQASAITGTALLVDGRIVRSILIEPPSTFTPVIFLNNCGVQASYGC
ncbi:SDR family oxidoreductase [Aneurinibacillus terranovensis]|uniref:SDR family oxidoreductase n=1 Tax=Aneurinibacillus terranovensis TaxID=278991 RepID=UPI0004843BE7|nr:SDR family oxidoreductase [Aneurinibacillus terranovensis]